MPELIRELVGESGPVLMIRSTDPAEIHRLAVEWAADEDGIAVAEGPDEIRVQSIRAVPWCPVECGCERNRTHYTPTYKGGRGSFRAALIELYYPEESEDA